MFLKEPNSTVDEFSVPEPFKTYCFLVLKTCQERPALLETKRKPYLHVSSGNSRSLGRKQFIVPSTSSFYPTSVLPRSRQLSYGSGMNVASNIHNTTEDSYTLASDIKKQKQLPVPSDGAQHFKLSS